MAESFKRPSVMGVPIISGTSTTTSIFDPTELVDEMKKSGVGDILVPSDDTMSLLEVSDWIPVDDDFKFVMDCQGIPCGHVTEVYGKKDSGKTTFATQVLVDTQKEGGIACLLDTEHKFSLKRAAMMGLDVKKLVIIQAETIEQSFEKFVKFAEKVSEKPEWSKRKVSIVWDSIGQTPAAAELDEKVKDFAMTAAKVIKGEFRQKRGFIAKQNIAFLIINQVYQNMNAFGKQTTPYGGSGPEYAASLILEFAKIGRVRPKGLKSPEPFAGSKIMVECVKNHIGQPFRTKEMFIDWSGFVEEKEVSYTPEE